MLQFFILGGHNMSSYTTIVRDVQFFDADGRKTYVSNAVRYEGNIGGSILRGTINNNLDHNRQKVKIGHEWYKFIPRDFEDIPYLDIHSPKFGCSNQITLINSSITWALNELRYGHKLRITATIVNTNTVINDVILDIIGNYIVGENNTYYLK